MYYWCGYSIKTVRSSNRKCPRSSVFFFFFFFFLFVSPSPMNFRPSVDGISQSPAFIFMYMDGILSTSSCNGYWYTFPHGLLLFFHPSRASVIFRCGRSWKGGESEKSNPERRVKKEKKQSRRWTMSSITPIEPSCRQRDPVTCPCSHPFSLIRQDRRQAALVRVRPI